MCLFANMTYNVFGGMLNPTLLLLLVKCYIMSPHKFVAWHDMESQEKSTFDLLYIVLGSSVGALVQSIGQRGLHLTYKTFFFRSPPKCPWEIQFYTQAGRSRCNIVLEKLLFLYS